MNVYKYPKLGTNIIQTLRTFILSHCSNLFTFLYKPFAIHTAILQSTKMTQRNKSLAHS